MIFAFGLILLLLVAVYWHERWRERKVERDRQERDLARTNNDDL
jgi:hypothetical protein